MPQYSVVDGNDDNSIRAMHALLDLRISPRPQRIRATAAILLFIDSEYNCSVPGVGLSRLFIKHHLLFCSIIPPNSTYSS